MRPCHTSMTLLFRAMNDPFPRLPPRRITPHPEAKCKLHGRYTPVQDTSYDKLAQPIHNRCKYSGGRSVAFEEIMASFPPIILSTSRSSLSEGAALVNQQMAVPGTVSGFSSFRIGSALPHLVDFNRINSLTIALASRGKTPNEKKTHIVLPRHLWRVEVRVVTAPGSRMGPPVLLHSTEKYCNKSRKEKRRGIKLRKFAHARRPSERSSRNRHRMFECSYILT